MDSKVQQGVMRGRSQSESFAQQTYRGRDAYNAPISTVPEHALPTQLVSLSTTGSQGDLHRPPVRDSSHGPYDRSPTHAPESHHAQLQLQHDAGTDEDALLTRYTCNSDLVHGDVGTQVGVYKQTGAKILVKRVVGGSSSDTAGARREIAVLEAVQGPSIPVLVEWLELDDDVVWSIQEYHETRSLGDLVRNSGPLSEHVVKLVMNQLFSGIASLFVNGFAHLRIHDATVHLDSHEQVVIRGLEHAHVYGNEKIGDIYAPIRDKQGSSDIYVAPEVFSNNLYNARKAVMWSCGVLLYFISTGQTDKLSNLEHPSFDKLAAEPDLPAAPTAPRDHRRKLSVAHAQAKVIMYPNRFAVASFARAVIPKMLVHDPRRRAELIEVASRVPKDFSSKTARPLMELAWYDYKTHVGPNADLHIPDAGNESSASSIFSAVSRMSNPFASLLNRADSRRKSAPVTSRYR